MSDAPIRETVAQGLDKAQQLTPGHGALELAAGARGEGGQVVAFARGEVLARVSPGLSLFAFGEGAGALDRLGWSAGAGLRLRW